MVGVRSSNGESTCGCASPWANRERLDANVERCGDTIQHHGVEHYLPSNDTQQTVQNGATRLPPFRSPFLDTRLVDPSRCR